MEYKEAIEITSSVLAEVLGCENINETDSIVDTLGAESIDLLDIVFRLEKSFSVRMPSRGLFRDAFSLKSDGMLSDGRLNDDGIKHLLSLGIDCDKFGGGITESDIPRLMRVCDVAKEMVSRVNKTK